MFRFCTLVCLLHFISAVPDPNTLQELVSQGWAEHKISNTDVTSKLRNITYSGITLTDSAVLSNGFMKLTGKPTYKRISFTSETFLKTEMDDLKIGYTYSLDTGEHGVINATFKSRTFSMWFHSSFEREKECKTTLSRVKLENEGPTSFIATGDKSDEALKIVNRLQYSIILQCRSFIYSEIMKAMQESIHRRRPMLCSNGPAYNASKYFHRTKAGKNVKSGKQGLAGRVPPRSNHKTNPRKLRRKAGKRRKTDKP